MTTLITGAAGFLGTYLMQEFPGAIGLTRTQCDLTDQSAVRQQMEIIEPSLIIHAAAMTNVEQCQKNPDLAIKTNYLATRTIVQSMPKDCKFVYISTDMVYSGEGPHKEDSVTVNPLNVYAMSKYMGELAAQEAANHLILRTNMYGHSKNGSGLINFLIEKCRSGEEFPLFTDLLFSPLHVRTLCKAISKCVGQKTNGTFNLGSYDGMSKNRFALMVAHILDLPIHKARPLESALLSNRVLRPRDTRTNVSKFERAFNMKLPLMEPDLYYQFTYNNH